MTGVSIDDPSVHVDLEPTPVAPRTARSFLAAHLGPVDPDSAYVAALCASELVTNGVLHARTHIVLGVTMGEQRLLVTVGDRAGGTPYPPPQDDERPSGRGLMLVAALADQWGVTEELDGKTVWFTISRTRT
ncbi:MAG TPA: ATP-binding protein [Mycobacteriales bacterium]|nr:ATP-binding protein [Mycobacteriales bacterium]